MNADRIRRVAQELHLMRSGQMPSVRFHGLSMYPFLQEGDRVVVEPVAWEEITAGDVITYRFLEQFPTRRVVRKTGDHLSLWCENWPERGFATTREHVLGRVAAREREGHWVRRGDAEWEHAARHALARYRRTRLRRLARRMRWAYVTLVRRPRVAPQTENRSHR